MSLPRTPVNLAVVHLGVVSTATMSGTTVTDTAGRLNFTAADVGHTIWIIGASDPIGDVADNGMLRTTIVSVTSGTVAVCADAATQTADAAANCTLFRPRAARVDTCNMQGSLTSHDTFSCTFFDALATPYTLQPIMFVVDGAQEFGGLIQHIKAVEVPGQPDYMEWQIDATGWEVIAYARTTGEPTDAVSIIANPFAGTFDNTEVGKIFKYLVVNALTAEGFDFVPHSDGPVIPTFKASYAPCGQAFDSLITAGSSGIPPVWMHWWCSPDKRFHLADNATTDAAPFNIEDSSPEGDFLDQVDIDYDANTFVNRVIVRQGNQISEPIPDTFVGDGSKRSFTLSGPAASAPVITLNGSPQTVGVQGINTGMNWYWSLNSATITQDTGGTVLTSGDTLVATTPQFHDGFATYYNNDAIDLASGLQGGTGYYEIVQQQDNPSTLTDGDTFATAIGQQFGVIPKRIIVRTLQSGLRIGQHFHVTRARLDIDSDFVIDSVTITTDGAWVKWEVTAVGSPFIDWDYRSTLASLRPGDGGGSGGGGGAPGPQLYMRTLDINDSTVGDNIGPNVLIQGTGQGIEIGGVLRKVITADLVVRVRTGSDSVTPVTLGTLTIPSGTAVLKKISTSIKTKKLLSGQSLLFDITGSDGQKEADGIATITVEWGAAGTQVTVTGQWRGAWDSGTTYALGDSVGNAGSSWISLQDGNTGNTPVIGDWWDLIAAKGDDGTAGVGVPTGGTAGQVLTKTSGTDYADTWADPVEFQPLTTKGDIFTYTTIPARKGVGTDGQALYADSGDATGLVWDDTRIKVQDNAVLAGTRPILNFIGLGSVIITVLDNSVDGRIDIMIGVGGGIGGSVPVWSLVGFGYSG